MAMSRSEWIRSYLKEATNMRRAARVQRDQRVKDTTIRWRQGFKALKEENDRLQEENELTSEQEINACQEYHMRGEDRCKSEFPPVQGTRGSGYQMCIRQNNIEYAQCKAAVSKNQMTRVQDITRKWKEGFAALKAENDRLQRQAAADYEREMIRIQGWINEQAVKPPPWG